MASRPPNKRMGPPLVITDISVLKKRLQELTQKLGLPPPACLTINEGSSHAPKFKTTVLVNGLHYIAQDSCSESAEQEALRIAYTSIKKHDVEGCPPRYQGLEEDKSAISRKFEAMVASFQSPNNRGISPNQKEAPSQSQAITECMSSEEQETARIVAKVEVCPSLYQNPIYCKSILHEYAVKMKMNNPKYQTKCKAGFPPRFISLVDLNGEEYLGEEAESKKEAEQLAAQAAIKHLLGSDSRTLVLIIKSKEIIFDLSPSPKPLLCIEHKQPFPSATGQVPSTGRGPSLRPPMADPGRRGPTFEHQIEIKQGENPDEAKTLREAVTFTNLGPGKYNSRGKRRAGSINWAQRKRKS